MFLKSSEFCALSTSRKWLNWLYTFEKRLYVKLTNILHEQAGCRAGRETMLEILKEVTATPAGTSRLEQFLSAHFPHVIEKDPAGLPVQRLHGQLPVFGHYDAGLLTVPRRTILFHQDRAALEALVRQFLAGQALGDYAIVDDYAYVEFLPLELAALAQTIPERNWRTRAWRAALTEQINSKDKSITPGTLPQN